MRTLVFFPLDATGDLLKKGSTMDEIEENYNPNRFFDRVYVISPKDRVDNYGTLIFLKAELSEIQGLVAQINPNAIRANAGFFCSDIAAACRAQGIPVMISIHDSLYERINQSIAFADQVVCISNIVKDAVINCTGISDNKLTYLPRYVDTKIFRKKYNGDIFSKLDTKYGMGKHILHVGRKEEQKNLENTILALKYLPEEYCLIAVGRGEIEKYQEVALKEGVSDRVFFEEGLSHEELSYFYSWCNCMCTPSRWEGFGLVFIEACACEAAVVTSDIAPMNEYLTDSESALLIKDIENPKEIAEKIAQACQDTEAIRQMKKNALKVAMKFDRNYAFTKEVENYKKLISDGPDLMAEGMFFNECSKLKLPVVIYGAGANGVCFLQYLKERGKNPLFFIDQSIQKQGHMIDGIKIHSLSKLKDIDEEYVVVVTPFHRKEIVDDLRLKKIAFMEMEWYQTLMEMKGEGRDNW